MVEATGESIYHTILTTKCSILPRHLLSIIMASLHSIGFSFPEFTRTRFPAKKTYWKTRRPWGWGSLSVGPRAHPVIKIGSRQIVYSGGKGNSQTGGKKRVRRKGQNREKSPFFMFLRTIFFFARLRPSLCLRRWPQVGRFYFVIKFSGRKQGYNTNETFPVFIYLFSFLSLIRGFPGAIEGWEIKLTRT